MNLTNFRLVEITEPSKRDELNAVMKREDGAFAQTSANVWIASFEADGIPRHEAIRLGRRPDTADDLKGYQVQLRVEEAEFEADTFIPEATVADIVKLVGDEFEKRIVVSDVKPAP
jgi:hypothetical protein